MTQEGVGCLPTINRLVLTTYSGSPIPPLVKGLPKEVDSLCPECAEIVKAKLFEEAGRVMMEKVCPDHGYFKELYWSDARLYLKAEDWFFADPQGFSNPLVKGATRCPSQCGICNMHVSNTACGNIDLTNRCNLTCPVCFANANASGYVYEPSLEQIGRMLENYRRLRPVPASMVQFSGGEPTLYPHFLQAIKAARDLGFSHIQVASNGLKFADLDFALRCKEAGLHTIYLQFDGLSDDVYTKTRGRPLLKEKIRAVENIRLAGLKIVFVPTVIKGVNDHEVGAILKFAIENIEVSSGITYQPVTFTGRIPQEERERMRFTLSDLAWAIEEQTGLARALEDWYPAGCLSPFSRLTSMLWGRQIVSLSCHPHCSLATYFFVDEDKKALPVTRFVEIPHFLREVDQLAEKVEKSLFKSYAKLKAFHSFKRFFQQERAPQGLTFTRFLQTLDGLMDKKAGRGPQAEGYTFKTLMVGGMHFMDAYNYQLERVRRCVVHYSAPNGLIYPFCTYNSGPTFREKIERRFSTPLKEWQRLRARQADQ